MPGLEIELEIALVGNLLASFDCGFLIGEEPIHLLGCADVELIAAIAHAVLILEKPARVDAKQHIVGVIVLLLEVMGIARRHQRQAEIVGDIDGAFRAAFLDVEAVVLDFDVEIVLENPMKPLGGIAGFVQLIEEDKIAELARRATGKADDAGGVGFEHLLVDARDVVVAFEVRDRRHFDEVLEADEVLGEQREVIARFAALFHGAVGAVRGGDVRLIADDGVQPGVLAFLVEFDGPEEIAVIGHGDGVHAKRFGERDQLRHPARAVEQAVMRVAMQMNEGAVGHGRIVLEKKVRNR